MALIRATTTSQEIFLELLIHIHTQTYILAHVISNPDRFSVSVLKINKIVFPGTNFRTSVNSFYPC